MAMPPVPPVTRALLIANVVAFLIQQVGGPLVIAYFALWPLGDAEPYRLANGDVIDVGFHLWQLVTYAFLHGGSLLRGDISHILFNMLALWMFGSRVEAVLRPQRFAVFYVVCVIGAALAQLAVQHLGSTPDDFYPTLGASGGVFGVLLAYAWLFPRERIYIYGVLPLPAVAFVAIYLVGETYLGLSGRQANVAHFAHLGGAASGVLLLIAWRIRALPPPRDMP